MTPPTLPVAVVTGGHSYDVIGLRKLWAELPGLHAIVQHLDDFCCSPAEVRQGYAAVVFFHMMQEGPSDEGPSYQGRVRTVLSELGATPQGVVIWHHALLAYPSWPLWRELTGLTPNFRDYSHREILPCRIAGPDHPLTRGLADWEMVDETYDMDDCDPDNEVLITTDHPTSCRTLAWTRTYRQARVLCYQCGHDAETWNHPVFREVLTRGVQWAAGNLA
jgi:hypothetical protein